MSNGSRTISEQSRPGRTQRHSRLLGVLVLSFVAAAPGCHHRTLHRGPELQAELTRVTAEDLFLLGVTHARSGDFLRAEQYLRAAQDRGHDQAAVAFWLVRVCLLASRYQSALGHASEYLRDHPGHWSLRLVVASIHEALGDVARAEAELQRIVRAEPDHPLPHYRLAMLYRKRNQSEALSRVHLEEYLRLSPHGRHAAEVESLLVAQSEAGSGPRLLLRPTAEPIASEGQK